MKYKILVIDDDRAILRLVQNSLENKNFVVDTRTTIPGIDICHFIGYDLIILDIMMPYSGIEICKYIRESIPVPIIFLTAKNLEEDIICGIQSGADDYITKPFSVQELVARVQMHIRREVRNNNPEQILQFGSLKIDKIKEELKIADVHIPTTKREFRLILLLSSNPNKTFSNDELFDYLYPYDSETQGRTITEYVYQIRKKLKPYDINPIKTIWGGGYKWDKL
ncbi:response regulator transcription factor [Streptococcus suis]|uniref:response regulator transcription factor n=1 Tax=Streptococcus suis TaxID=1307 RepID=UPI000C188B5B|nr:response regulator transcription factor [Streptococcus suis]